VVVESEVSTAGGAEGGEEEGREGGRAASVSSLGVLGRGRE